MTAFYSDLFCEVSPVINSSLEYYIHAKPQIVQMKRADVLSSQMKYHVTV